MKKLILLVIVVAIIAALASLAHAQKAKWHGLTETEVREKLSAKFGNRLPEAKKAHVQDAIVNKMRARGALRDESTEVASA